MEILPIILYIGVILNIIAFILLYRTSAVPKPESLEYVIKQEEVAEAVPVEIVQEEVVVKKERKERQIVDTRKILEETRKETIVDEEVTEFDMRVFEPLKYERGIPLEDEEKEETKTKEELIEKRLQIYSDKIDRSIRK